MHQIVHAGRSRSVLADIPDASPFRGLYIKAQNATLYDRILDYFNVVAKHLWNKDDMGISMIVKTVGIQALFDILKFSTDGNHAMLTSDQILSSASGVDFSNNFFQASGIGRRRIRDVIALRSGLISDQGVGEDVKSFVKHHLRH